MPADGVVFVAGVVVVVGWVAVGAVAGEVGVNGAATFVAGPKVVAVFGSLTEATAAV